MRNLITYSEIEAAFNSEIRPAVIEQYGEGDEVALSQAWNDYTDGECKDGALTDLEYNYCPHVSELGAALPDDDEAMLSYILEQLGVEVTATYVRSRPDGLLSDAPMIHWLYALTRAGRSMGGHYSQGVAHHLLYRHSTGYTVAIKEDLQQRRNGDTRGLTPPTAADILAALLADASGDLDDFADWCADMGMDDDSRTAERIFNACRDVRDSLAEMFSASELESLHERAAMI